LKTHNSRTANKQAGNLCVQPKRQETELSIARG